MSVHVIAQDEDGEIHEFDLISSFDNKCWWCYDSTIQKFTVLIFQEELLCE